MELKSMTGSKISPSEVEQALNEGYCVYKAENGQLYRSWPNLGLNDYQQLAQRTAKPLPSQQRIWHGCQGVASEGGEMLTVSKANQFYNKPLDHVNLIEEVGDALWYLAEICNGLGVPLALAAVENIDKLKKRYPDKYSDALAVERLDKK